MTSSQLIPAHLENGILVPDNPLEIQTNDTQELSLAEIYDRIYADEDIIIVIDAVEETRVRKGLSSIKAKRNSKLKDNDLPTDDSVLEFKTITTAEGEIPKGTVKLQIYLKRKPTVTVHSLIVADKEL